jgi:Protein of unknown function (DUF3309)
MNLGIILLVLLAAFLVHTVPLRPFTAANWAYHPSGGLSGGLGVILVLSVALLVMANL